MTTSSAASERPEHAACRRQTPSESHGEQLALKRRQVCAEAVALAELVDPVRRTMRLVQGGAA